MLPPFWSLGFHLCRWGYNSIENLTAVMQVTLIATLIKNVFHGFVISI